MPTRSVSKAPNSRDTGIVTAQDTATNLDCTWSSRPSSTTLSKIRPGLTSSQPALFVDSAANLQLCNCPRTNALPAPSVVLKSVNTWVMAEAHSRGEEMGSVGEIDQAFGTMGPNLDMTLLFRPPSPRSIKTEGGAAAQADTGKRPNKSMVRCIFSTFLSLHQRRRVASAVVCLGCFFFQLSITFLFLGLSWSSRKGHHDFLLGLHQIGPKGGTFAFASWGWAAMIEACIRDVSFSMTDRRRVGEGNSVSTSRKTVMAWGSQLQIMTLSFFSLIAGASFDTSWAVDCVKTQILW
ncbi:hypothetical protein QBC39DRAFT_137100 [Podospora conica]|nr:hypothetical protein QBC39DRAFT_137100 [Schizothecium conicum]